MFSIEQVRENNKSGLVISSFTAHIAATAVVHDGPRFVHRLGKAATDARELSRDGDNGLHGYGGVESARE